MLKIGTKLGLGIGTLVGLCVIIGLVSYTQTRLVGKKVQEITQIKEPMNSAVQALENNLVETAFATLGYVSTGDQKFLDAFRKNEESLGQLQQKYVDVAGFEDTRTSAVQLQENFGRFHAIAVEQIHLKDLQTLKVRALLKDLDVIDNLLTEKIQASVKADDPLAYRRLQAALEMEVYANAITKGLGSYLLTKEPQFESRVQEAEREFRRFSQVYHYVLLTSDEKRWAGDLRRLSDESFVLARIVIDQEKLRVQKWTEFVGIYRGLGSILNDRIQMQSEKNLADAKEDVLQAGQGANTRILVVLLFSMAFGIGIGVVTTKNITGPLHQLASVMNAIANGDRAQRVQLKSSDELRAVGEAFNLMTGQLVEANEVLRAEIAERARAEEALRISEEHFRLSIEGVKDYAIFMLDPEGRVASWNAGAEHMKGYRADEILGRPFSVFYPAEDIQSGKPGRELHLADEEGRFEDVGWRVRKDGTRFWANVVITAVRDDAGTLRGFSKVTRNITDKKKMEEDLRESELRFRTVFQDAPIGIALSDCEGRFVQTNPALQEMLGSTGAGLSGQQFVEFMHPDDALASGPLFRETVKGARSRYQAEIKYTRKDGRPSWVNLNVSRMHNDQGHQPYSIIMMEDITGRRETEQKMRMLAHTITSMNESVVITDSQNVILSVNPAFQKTYGYEEQEIRGEHADILEAGTTDGKPPEKVLAIMRAGGWTGEVIHRRKDGENFPVLLSTSLVRDDTGAPIALVWISRDITEQKLLQQRLDEAQRQRSAGLRRFATSVQRAQEEERERISRELHDDLCQRLSGIKFRVEVLEDEVQPLNKKVFRRLREFTHELDKTITEVRRISSNLRPSVLDDFGLVIALKLLCKDFEKLHSIKTTFHLGSSAHKVIDPNVEIALYRIAQEALSNVASHSAASTAALHLLPEDSSVQLIIEDDGKGFSEMDAAKAKGSGHGLGLISMKERAELLDGNFEVDSACNKGTTISVTIPTGEYAHHEEDKNPYR